MSSRFLKSRLINSEAETMIHPQKHVYEEKTSVTSRLHSAYEDNMIG